MANLTVGKLHIKKLLNNLFNVLTKYNKKIKLNPNILTESKITKGSQVKQKDINTETSYIIVATYPNGFKRVYNDVTIRNYSVSSSSSKKIKSFSFVYNKDYELFKKRDGFSPKPYDIPPGFSSLKFHYTKKSDPLKLSNISTIKISNSVSKSNKDPIISKSIVERSSSINLVPNKDPFLNTNQDFLAKGGKKPKGKKPKGKKPKGKKPKSK